MKTKNRIKRYIINIGDSTTTPVTTTTTTIAPPIQDSFYYIIYPSMIEDYNDGFCVGFNFDSGNITYYGMLNTFNPGNLLTTGKVEIITDVPTITQLLLDKIGPSYSDFASENRVRVAKVHFTNSIAITYKDDANNGVYYWVFINNWQLLMQQQDYSYFDNNAAEDFESISLDQYPSGSLFGIDLNFISN